jgi:hypothetical protein
MKKKMGIVVAAIVVIAVAVAVVWIERRGGGSGMLAGNRQVSAFSKQPFTADMTINSRTPKFHQSPGGMPGTAPAVVKKTYHGKMYAGPAALRTDVEMGPGRTAAVIVRYDKGFSWILMPGKRYLQVPIHERSDLLSALRDKNAHVQKQDLGTETIGAYPCEKYHVQATEKGRPESGWIWVAKAENLHGFIVKAEDEKSKESVVFSDISLTAPNPSVFDLPAGYHELTQAPPAPPAASH